MSVDVSPMEFLNPSPQPSEEAGDGVFPTLKVVHFIPLLIVSSQSMLVSFSLYRVLIGTAGKAIGSRTVPRSSAIPCRRAQSR